MTTRIKQTAHKLESAIMPPGPPPDPVGPATIKLSAIDQDAPRLARLALDYAAALAGVPSLIAWGEVGIVQKAAAAEQDEDAGRYVLTGTFAQAIPPDTGGIRLPRMWAESAYLHNQNFQALWEEWGRYRGNNRLEVRAETDPALVDDYGLPDVRHLAVMKGRVELAARFIDQVNLFCWQAQLGTAVRWQPDGTGMVGNAVRFRGFFSAFDQFQALAGLRR